MIKDPVDLQNLGKALISKLTKEEIRILCIAYEYGILDEVFEKVIFPKDEENYPEDYRSTIDEDIIPCH